MNIHLRSLACGAALVVAGALVAQSASAGIIRISEGAFQAGSGLITFSEFPLATVNPSYTPANYGGDVSDPDVNFDGWFDGQGFSGSPAVDCPGGAASGCVVGTPTSPLSLDPASPDTFISSDGANPTSPVLSGSPLFNGPVAILFSHGVAGVGLDGGYFDNIGSTKIEAFDKDGNSLGSVMNTGLGIEFLGLVTSDKSETIYGLIFSLVGAEGSGFAIDNVRFGASEDIVIGVPEPAELGMFGLGVLLIGLFVGLRRRIG